MFKVGDRVMVSRGDGVFYHRFAAGEISYIHIDVVGVKFNGGAFRLCSDNTWMVGVDEIKPVRRMKGITGEVK